jgi:hypothetical protein
MSSAKLAIACALAAVVLSACGTKTNPPAGSISPTATTAGHAKIDDPRTKHIKCLKQDKIPVTKVGTVGLQIGTPPSGPTVKFAPTPGAAQADQIRGVVNGAEVIGSALLFPNQASDELLGKVETCLTQGVSG